MEAGIRNQFGLNIVAMEREHDTTIDIQPTYRFRKEDVIVVIGKRDNINRFEAYLSEE